MRVRGRVEVKVRNGVGVRRTRSAPPSRACVSPCAATAASSASSGSRWAAHLVWFRVRARVRFRVRVRVRVGLGCGLGLGLGEG